MNKFTPFFISVSIIGLLTSSAYADKFGQIQTALSPQPHQFQRAAPMAPPAHMQPHMQRVPQPNIRNVPIRPLNSNVNPVQRQIQTVPQQHFEGHHMRNDGFHVEFNNQHGRGHFGRFHQRYFPFYGYPYTYYYQSSPTVEDTTTVTDEDNQDQIRYEIQPKIIKILPDGTVVDKSPPKSDDDSSNYDDDAPQ